jgi:molybdopterin converting factor small subunit
MRITIHYMTQIKRAAGRSSDEIDVPAATTLRDALRSVAERHGPDFRGMLLDDAAEPRRSLLFFVGDEHADIGRPLREGDAVTILAPMAGG